MIHRPFRIIFPVDQNRIELLLLISSFLQFHSNFERATVLYKPYHGYESMETIYNILGMPELIYLGGRTESSDLVLQEDSYQSLRLIPGRSLCFGFRSLVYFDWIDRLIQIYNSLPRIISLEFFLLKGEPIVLIWFL